MFESRNEPNISDGFKSASRYFPWIIGIGIALGIANYSLGFWPTLGQSIFQQIAISIIIGYGILLSIWFVDSSNLNTYSRYVVLLLLCVLFGVLGSMGEQFIKCIVFDQLEFTLLGNSQVYVFNAILSSILGSATYYWSKSRASTPGEGESIKGPGELNNVSKITELPIKQGDVISLYSLQYALYFEAYDNYSFLFNSEGDRILTNYALHELEQKLRPDFIRVHRKFLINKNWIHQIRPDVKGRYTIYFRDKKMSSLRSSASYVNVIKGIIKI